MSTATKIIAALVLPLIACDTTTEDDFDIDVETRTILFDSAEVNEDLEDGSVDVLLVDLRVGNIVEFDQTAEPFDFEAFNVICPSMDRPMPMVDWMSMMDLDFEDRDQWYIYSVETQATEFRAVADGGGPCFKRCNSSGTDCVWDCG